MSFQGGQLARSLAIAAAIGCWIVPSANAGSATSGIYANPVGGEFDKPTYVTSAPGAPRLLFVVERDGVVRVMRNGRTLARPFLNISGRVSAGGEGGLLSIAFAPGYERNRRLYAYFTNNACRTGCDLEVAEFRRAPRSATRARRTSYRRVIAIRHRDAGTHNGGTILFGPDRKLWLATGDGGGANDPFDNARHRTSLLGKLLRIDPRKPQRKRARRGYRIPRGNPFVGRHGRDEIWAIGLRNPFRFSFDPPTGRIAIADVGQNAMEEVNILPISAAKGADFGWPRYEGTIEREPDRPGAGPRVEPVYEYVYAPRDGSIPPQDGVPAPRPAAAVTGGVFLRDPRFAGVFDVPQGVYLFTDFYATGLWRFEPTSSDFQTLPNAPVRTAVGFGTDQQDRVHVASLGGRVYRLDPAPAP